MTNLESMTPIDLDEQAAIDGGVWPYIVAGIVLCIFADPSVNVNLWGAQFSVSC